jgi:putative RNA 2'-phosphotransferase
MFNTSNGIDVMNQTRSVSIRKFMNLVLRREPRVAGVALDPEGWADVDDLLQGAARKGFVFHRAELDEVVATTGEQRITFSDDRRRIRAS